MSIKDKICGGLLGGAIGDALGYPVEFRSENEIFKRYTAAGITSYEIDFENGLALVSDDTQMSMFTANGILRGETVNKMKGLSYPPSTYIAEAYHDWYCTQINHEPKKQVSWLMDLPYLHERRAPGSTCLSALSSEKFGSIDNPLNMSKGCDSIIALSPRRLRILYTIHVTYGR